MPLPDAIPLTLDTPGAAASSGIYSEAPADYAATQAFIDKTLALSDERLNALMSGASSGNAGNSMREWGEVFAHYSHQGVREGLAGYDQQAAGVAFGADTSNWLDKAILGASLSYGHTNTEPRDNVMPTTHSDAFQLSLYGNYDIAEHSYLRGMLAYAHSFNDAHRPSFGSDSHGEYGADEFLALAKAGHTFGVGKARVTPSILARWTHYDPSDYTESGAGGDSLHVSQSTLDSLEVGPGLDATWVYKQASGSWFVPSVHAGYRYDLIGEKISATFSGSCCGTFTSTGPTPPRSIINVGTSLTWYSTAAWEVKGGYDYDYGSAYAAHTGMLRATFHY